MKLKNFTHIITLFITLVFVAFNIQAKEDKNLGLYVNLYSTNTITIGHAFAQSIKMKKRGHPITVFLNGGAILVAVKDAPQENFKNKSLQKWMLELIENGGKILVCQVCMKIHKITDDELVAGTVKATPAAIAEYLFDPRYKVISW